MKNITEAKDKIQEEENRLAERSGGSTATLTENIDRHRQEIASLDAEMHELEAKHTIDKTNLETAERHLSELSRQEQAKSKELQEAEGRLRNVGSSNSDPMKGYPNTMRELLRLIENERGFLEKPIGPLGLHITLKDPKWEGIIEKYLGGTLSSFVVTNHNDGNLLGRLMEKARCRVNYSVTRPKKFTPLEPSDQYLTVLRVLEIDNEATRTQLIVGHGAEQTILIEDRDFANNLMRDRRPSDNIQQCFSINKHKAGYGFRIGGAIGVSSLIPVPPFRGYTHMKSGNINAQIEMINGQINDIKNVLRDITMRKNSAQQTVGQLKHTISDFQREIRQFNHRISKGEDEIERLQSRIEEINADGELGVHQERLKVGQHFNPFLSNANLLLGRRRKTGVHHSIL